MEEIFANWKTQARKGLLELAILNALLKKERYAYSLVGNLLAVPGLGVSEGTVYPLLSRLLAQGLVSSRLEGSAQGPVRKYYALTPEGRKVAERMNRYFDLLHRGMAESR